MMKDIKEYVKTCFQYQQRGSMKQNNQKRTISPTDIFERWEEARSLKVTNANTVVTFLYKEIICRFEAPKILQSDRGTYFVNKVIQKLTKRFKIKHILSSSYHS